ncbi:MAG: carbohydrate kinase family protein [Patescibacteria group bacterium]
MYDLISIGNITADLFFDGEELTKDQERYKLAIGGKYFVDSFYSSVGGGGANVAIGTKRLGLRTAVCGFVGNNVFRQMILTRLRKMRISTKLLLFSQKYTNLSIILSTKTGERTIINHETPHEHLKELSNFRKKLQRARAIYFGNLPDVSFGERVALLKKLKKSDVLIIGNIGKRDCCRPKQAIAEYLKHIDIFIVNRYEFAEVVRKDPDILNLQRNMLKFLPSFHEKLLVVTDGGNGSYAHQNGEVYYQKALTPKKLVDTTGAGDGYTAGFIASYLRNEDIKLAMKKGAQYASRIIAKLGAN